MKTIILISGFVYASLSFVFFPGESNQGRGNTGILQSLSSVDTARYVFVGAEACATKCHNNEEMGFQYDLWKKSAHSMAFSDLSSDQAREYAVKSGITVAPAVSPVCLKCHTAASEAGAASISSTYKKEDGITCESCHKGEFKPKTYLPKESDCLECHNSSVHQVAPFAFEEKCRLIAHPRPKMKQE
jgi:hypothetical protein